MRRIAAALIGALCFARGAASQAPGAAHAPPPAKAPASRAPAAPKDAAPDLAFLEYLGSWQGDDDEWLAVKEWDQDAAPKGAAAKPPEPPAKPKEPAPQPAGSDHEKNQ